MADTYEIQIRKIRRFHWEWFVTKNGTGSSADGGDTLSRRAALAAARRQIRIRKAYDAPWETFRG